MLPKALAQPLREQLAGSRKVWAEDLAAGTAGVEMPSALERKYPRAGASWPWFWLFPQDHHSTDPCSGVVRRHHLYDQTFQCAFKRAVQAAQIDKPATPHTLRHCFATHLLQARQRYSNRARLARARRRSDDHDLHPRAQRWRRCSAKSAGHTLINRVALERTLASFCSSPSAALVASTSTGSKRCGAALPRPPSDARIQPASMDRIA